MEDAQYFTQSWKSTKLLYCQYKAVVLTTLLYACETLKRAGMQNVHGLAMSHEWVVTKKVFYGELQVRKRSQGGQKKRYKVSLKEFKYHQSPGNRVHRTGQSGVDKHTLQEM